MHSNLVYLQYRLCIAAFLYYYHQYPSLASLSPATHVSACVMRRPSNGIADSLYAETDVRDAAYRERRPFVSSVRMVVCALLHCSLSLTRGCLGFAGRWAAAVGTYACIYVGTVPTYASTQFLVHAVMGDQMRRCWVVSSRSLLVHWDWPSSL